MPQMSPLMWLPLFMMFIMTLLIITFILYFNFKYSVISLSKNFMINKTNWKW